MDAGNVDTAHWILDWGHLPTLLGFPAVHEYAWPFLFLRVKILRLRLSSSLALEFGLVRPLQHSALPRVRWNGAERRLVAREILHGRPRSRNCLLSVSERTLTRSFNPKGDTDAFVLLRIRFLPWLSVHRAIHVYVGVLDRAQER